MSERLRRRRYLSEGTNFVLSIAFAACWVAMSVWISMPWIDELTVAVRRSSRG